MSNNVTANRTIFKLGVENTRTEPVNRLIVTVFMIDLLDDDKVVHQEDLDMSYQVDRKRIGRLTAFAVKNHYSIETMSKNDAEAPITER